MAWVCEGEYTSENWRGNKQAILSVTTLGGAMLVPSRLFSKDDSIVSSMRRIGQSRHSCGISWVSSVPNKFKLEPLLSIHLTHTLIDTRFIATPNGITKPTQLSWATSQREPQTSTCLRCLCHQRAANIIGGAGVGYLSGGKYHVRICLACKSRQHAYQFVVFLARMIWMQKSGEYGSYWAWSLASWSRLLGQGLIGAKWCTEFERKGEACMRLSHREAAGAHAGPRASRFQRETSF